MFKIVESNKIVDLLDYVDEETLVLLDIDNTLIESMQHVGSVAWFSYMLDKLENTGLDTKEAINRIYPVWLELQYAVQVRTVEKDTASVVKQLHNQGIKTMGLTARGFDLGKRTVEQLNSVEIFIENNTIYHKKVELDTLSGFVDGILFMNPEGDKGERLFQFLDKINFSLKKVVFVDDSPFFIDGVKSFFVEKKIPFIGIRYGGADARLKTFSPAHADDELRTIFAGKQNQSIINGLV